ncbi:MAG TPA: urease accessory protein UreE [Sphingomonas sp.]
MEPLRVVAILPRGQWFAAGAVDRVLLDHDARHRRRFSHRTEAGARVLIDLPQAVVLGDGDGLRLENGRTIAVAAAPEALMEVTAADATALARLAWHVGNRHLPAEIAAAGLRLRWDHVIAAMLEGLGAHVHRIEAPFSPEAGAYAGGERTHGHGHHHDQEPSHGARR